jgi:uncharacterized membrane protein
MPTNIGVFHPQIVHFVIALVMVGVVLRLVSLTGRLRWTSPAALTLILIGTVAAILAVQTGDAAHPPVERIPGARHAVEEHEEWGDRTRNILIVVSVLELAAFFVGRSTQRSGVAKGLLYASALGGLVAAYSVFMVGDLGGDIVYEYGGGPGIRSGDPQDVQNLLVAGLYGQAMQARKAGKHDEAARLVDELIRQRPSDVNVRLLGAESLMQDRNDGRAALDALTGVRVPANDMRTKQRVETMRADAYMKLGQRDSAAAIMDALVKQYPDNPRLKVKADSIRAAA